MADKSAEELYKERDQRIRDTIAMKIPDRVPVLMAEAKSLGLEIAYGTPLL